MRLDGLRLLMTSDTIGGVWTYAVDLAASLTAMGARVALATMGNPLSADQWRQVRGVARLQVFESRYRLEWMEDPWQDVAEAGEWLLALERRLRPDVVHLNGYSHAALPWRAPSVVVGHSCVLSWWSAVLRCRPPERFAPYHRAVRDGLAAADEVVAPSRAMLHALQTHYGPLPRVRVIHNGRCPTQFRAGAKQHVTLTVGRLWDQAKNIQGVAEAAAGTDWPVRVAGEAKHPDGGAVTLRNVEFLGHLPPRRLRELYAESAIYAFPARYEPFGLSVLEAALSGCALLLGDIDSQRELWNGAALFVPPDDQQAIGRELRRLTGDGALRSRLMTAARKRARAYSLEAMAVAYADLYTNLLSTDRKLLAGGELRPGSNR